MKILAIIPARAGSKRLPGKNVRLLDGKPLIAYTIMAAQKAACCNQIVVSTDSQEIADISLQYGASVPWLRPESLAEDSSDVIYAVIDMLERYQSMNINFDSVLLLQPTSPFRKPDTIKQAVEMHIASGLSVVSVNSVAMKPSWYRTIDTNGNLSPSELFNNSLIPEETSPLYKLNGSVYIASTEQIMTNKSFYSSPTKALIVAKTSEGIDVDTVLDWALVEKLVELKEETLP
ncbi:cytidylyltransferase domain-containing protein [Legionella cardiaca]|uniref:Acylneuraminate cytidylyltransferase family protein n=1 Tax=Legionella cardiaca TaxID=1071983 RepID=A0ABY8AMY8_9GAMM|nr:acylneuraminate cytidylyltransferase family protein [Legionella cardiaca]WED41893.1 acylneuraminate cytidylyltransferase family protein [Legionella cardiaca]